MARPRILVIVIAAIAAAIALVVRPAQAQHRDVPHPSEPSLEWFISALADAGVRVEPQAALREFATNLDEFVPVYLAVDGQYSELVRQGTMAPGKFTSVRDMRRLNEIEEAAITAERKLVEDLFTRLGTAILSEESSRLDAAKAMMLLDVEVRRVNRTTPVPSDLGQWLRTGTAAGRGSRTGWVSPLDGVSDEEFAAQRDVIYVLRTAKIAERTESYRAVAKERRAARVEKAQLAEELGIVGLSYEEAQEDSKKRYEATVGASEDKEVRRAAYVEYERRMSQIADAYFPRFGQDSPVWYGVVKQQMAAYKEVESKLTDAQRRKLFEEGWLQGMLSSRKQKPYVGVVKNSRSQGLFTPRGVVSGLLRMDGLSEDTKSKVREIGRALAAEYDALLLQEVQAGVAAGTLGAETQVRHELFHKKLAELGELVGHPEIDGELGGRLDGSLLNGTLNTADAEEFGNRALFVAAEDIPPDPPEAQHQNRSDRLLPVDYGTNYADALAARLGVGDGERAVLVSLVADATARWESDVAPLVKTATVSNSINYQSSEEDRAKYYAAVNESKDPALRAFAAAAACDGALIEAVRTALGKAVSADALAVAALERRISEAATYNPMSEVPQRPLNIARAALDAPLSSASREVALKAVAGTADEWRSLAAQSLHARREWWRHNRNGDQSKAQRPQDYPAEAARVEASNRQVLATNEAWEAQVRATETTVADALPPEEAELWRGYLRRLQWPQWYADTSRPREQALAALSNGDATELRARVNQIFDIAQQSVQLAGDGAVSVASSWTPPPRGVQWDGSASNDIYARARSLGEVGQLRVRLAEEQARALMPAEAARAVPSAMPIQRLSR